MNCERCQELIGDLIDGTLSGADESTLKTHLDECLDCVSVRQDLTSILSYCHAHRGEYEAPPNERALWVGIRNVIEAEMWSAAPVVPVINETPREKSWWSRSWELSFPQLASLAVGIVLLVSLVTVVGLRRWQTTTPVIADRVGDVTNASITDRVWQRQQVINYWNQRIELNKARWSSGMRATFDRNMRVIDQAVSDSMNELNRNPHDEVSEQMLNEALNDKLALLKEFSDL
ncbi:MAG TPA: zf-HC2 domain-containing protein [Pyrinomonadaceae bacterium]|nr:zf-HC2 domain-containing protein [Pyrinomonadaceae bacterium]